MRTLPQGIEQGLLGGAQQLGVPLHAHTESSGALRCLDHPVGAAAGDAELPGVIDGLVVGAVDRNGVSEQGAQAAVGKRDGMPAGDRVGGLFVVYGMGECVRMCWCRVPPAATARAWRPPQIPSTGMSWANRPGEVKLGVGAVFVGGIEAPFDRLAVVPWVDVKSTTGEQHARKGPQKVPIRLGGGRNEHHVSACALECGHERFLAHDFHTSRANRVGDVPAGPRRRPMVTATSGRDMCISGAGSGRSP